MSDAADRTLAVVTGGLRSPSSTRLLADQLAEATVDELAAHGVPVGVHVIDLREHAHDITNHLLTGFAAPALRETLDRLNRADGVIAVSPIFNASYSGLFKSFFDVTDDESLVDKPVLVAATGGTARHSLALEHALRPLFAYLRAVVVPTSVYASAEDWASGGSGVDASLRTRIERAAKELADAMRRYQRPAPPDPFALTQSFEDLLPTDR